MKMNPVLSSGVCRFTLKTEIKFNRPNIIIKDQELKKCLLIDMAVSAEQITRRVEFPVH